jgi:hypothetical protein
MFTEDALGWKAQPVAHLHTVFAFLGGRRHTQTCGIMVKTS